MDIASAVGIVFYFAASIGYGMVMEWFWRGQTLGKRLLGLRVMDAQGLKLKFSQVVVRNLLRAVDSLPLLYFVGGITCLASSRFQRIGDLAGNTIVVRYPKPLAPDLSQILAGTYNSFHDYPYLEAQLRQRTTPREAGIALQAILRRDRLRPRARVALFQEIARHFMRAVKFPEDVVSCLSDEQVVRNVVDILYREQLTD